MGPAYGVQFYGSDRIIRTASFLAFLSTYKTWQRYWWNWNFGFSKVIQNLVVDISLNQDYSGDSNGGYYVSIPALGDENRNLPWFCLPTLPRKSPWGTGAYYTPLARHS